ncbi:MAG: hypothetical protein IJC11_05035 [Alphaproteobacteria bacterium]|nr:hypothetical protein [Alphaproteobacteria bacterium]
MSDRPKSSADAIDVVQGFVHHFESQGVRLIKSGDAYNFQRGVQRNYDYDFYSDSESVEGEVQGMYCSDVDAMMSCLHSFRDIYAQNPDMAEEMHKEVVRLHQNKDSIADRRASDLLGVYFLQEGFPSINDFKNNRRHKEEYTFAKDGKYSDQEAVLLFDDDWYVNKFGDSYNDERFNQTDGLIRWGKLIRSLVALEKTGNYRLEWNENKSDCEIKSKDGKVSYGKISDLTMEHLNEGKCSGFKTHRNLWSDVYLTYQEAKNIGCPIKENMEWLMGVHQVLLNKEPTTNKTIQTQGGGTRVNPDNGTGIHINENGTIRL